MGEQIQQAITSIIEDVQPALVPLLALCFVVAGVTMMFGDMGRRWAKMTLIFSIIGFIIAAGALLFARSVDDTVDVGTIYPSIQYTINTLNTVLIK
ncbi:hypothetical protein I4131_12205 [Staphylococcus aureus]|nr:hypothetical protein [Staphylococcus aureus]